MERLVAIGEKMGLTGADLRQFMTDQQTIEREETKGTRIKERRTRSRKKGQKRKGRRSRKSQKRKGRRSGKSQKRKGRRRGEMIAAERERKRSLEMKRLELEVARIKDTPIRVDHTSAVKLPKIAPFQDGKDELDSYLLRFERFARANRWEDERWAGTLSALLSGKALDVYSRLSEEAAVDYRQ